MWTGYGLNIGRAVSGSNERQGQVVVPVEHYVCDVQTLEKRSFPNSLVAEPVGKASCPAVERITSVIYNLESAASGYNHESIAVKQ